MRQIYHLPLGAQGVKHLRYDKLVNHPVLGPLPEVT